MDDAINKSPQSELADDLLWGAQAIADYIGESLHRTQYLIRTGAIPVAKLGPKTLIGRKRQLDRHLTPKNA
jgi:hypothetical protein